MLNISILKIFLFSTVFLFHLSCLKQNSGVFSNTNTTNNNYFIRHIGADIVSSQSNHQHINSALKSFFEDDEYGNFNMNYNIVSHDNVSNKKQIIDDIITTSSKLDSNSTLVYFYYAHGSSDGTWSTTTEKLTDEIIYPTTIIEALRQGRQIDPTIENDENAPLKPAFKRLIIMAESCHSGEFMSQFRNAITERNNKKKPKIFDEGIYIYSSDSTLETESTLAGNILYPILFFLRAQQIESCTSQQPKSYTEIYNNIVKPFLSKKVLYQYSINSILKQVSLNKLIKTKKFNEKNPTFNDLYTIIERIKKYNSGFKMNILFNDENNNKQAPVRYNSIFPAIDNCN